MTAGTRQGRTAIDEAHRDVKLVNVELAAVVDVGEVPRRPSGGGSALRREGQRRKRRDSPNRHELFGAESGLAKDFLGHAAGQEAAALLVPRAEDLVVPLLLFRRQFPRDRDARLAHLLLVVLLELLLKGHLLRRKSRSLRHERLLLLLRGELHLARVHVRRGLDSLRRHERVEELRLDACAHPARVEPGRLRAKRRRRGLLLLLLLRVEARVHGSLEARHLRLHLHWLRRRSHLLLLPHEPRRLRLRDDTSAVSAFGSTETSLEWGWDRSTSPRGDTRPREKLN